MRRSLALAIALVASLVAPLPAQATAEALPEFDPDEIVFPVDGDNHFSDTFDAPRDGHLHEATDIMTYGVKGVPVVAAAAGEIDWMSSTCCALSIDHGGGWETWYIHLNNDTPGTDDGEGEGIAEGIEPGTIVEAGQLIGWVGDSGNAENTAPHLHFEIKDNGEKINPYPYLLKAESAYVGQFLDDEESTHQADIDKLYEAGITYGCNPPLNNEYCPEREISRGEMAAFIVRALDLTETTDGVPYDDVAGDTFAEDIARLHAAGIAFGCDADNYCPDRPLLREEMAELLVRGFGYVNPDGIDHFVDDEESQFQESINKLATHEVTFGCNPPDNTEFCPNRTLTRAEMASFFVRAKDL